MEVHSIAESFFDLKAKDIDGNVVNFHEYQNNKVIMIINVASEWGLTNMSYKDMISLHEELSSQGF